MKILTYVLPSKLFYADRLTLSARRLLVRLGIGGAGVAIAAVGSGLLNRNNWPDVVSGALFAWAVSLVAWAVNSYRDKTDDLSRELRQMAELDLLHARLNHLSAHLGLPLIDLQAEIESVLTAREERLAHFAGVDEFRPTGFQPGAQWWDATALGMRCEPDV